MLASAQKIKNIRKAENSDNLEIVEVLDYEIVVQKGKHYINQIIVFFELDSILPDWPEYSFLKGRNRIKTIRLRGNISQGLVMSVKDYFTVKLHEKYNIGFDLTEVLKVKKYMKPEPKGHNQPKGNFPSFIVKTDEKNIQSNPGVWQELIANLPLYATIKEDGTSMTVFSSTNRELEVCSRNLILKEDKNSIYWKMVEKYKLKDVLKNYDQLAIQGEIVGPGIQKNPMKLKENEFRIFDIFDIKTQKYLNFDYLEYFCDINYLKMVSLVYGISNDENTIKGLLRETASNVYYDEEKNIPAEGIVVRPINYVYSNILKKRLSVKILNPNYKD